MHLKNKSFFWMLLGLLVSQCNTKTSSNTNNKDTTVIQVSQNMETLKPDTIKLLNVQDLKVSELISYRLVDTFVTPELGENCYLEKTVRLNDSIYYTVFSVGDKAGACSYHYVASLSTKRKKAISTRLLHPDCDVDYSWDKYDLYEHALVSKNKIEIIKNTVFQKKNRTSLDEEKNIDHKEIQKSYLTISPTGKISNSH